MGTVRRLYLMRHAKSSWDDPNLADHERPLAPRGQRAVTVMAAHMAANEVGPDLILCSTARRTRETLEGLGLRCATMIEHRLYGASAEDLIERLRMVPPELGSVLLIGHNPALRTLVLGLAAGEAADRPEGGEGLAEIDNKLPTAALVTLELSGGWEQLEFGSATLRDYARPKALQFR